MTTAQTEATAVLDAIELLDSETSGTELAVALGRVAVEQAAAITAGGALPSGAATSAKQDIGNTSLASIDAKLTNPIPISAASLPLPSGAATQATLASILTALGAALTVNLPSGASTAANQSTANTSLSSILAKLTAATTGAAAAVAMTTASATLIASNANRIGLIFFNPLSVALYVRLENADAAVVQSFWVQPGETYELPKLYYTGIVKGALASGTGNVFVTELT